MLFFRATTLVSARNSHSSGVHCLVVRCLLLNPEGPYSNPYVCGNLFYKHSEAQGFHFFRHYETSPLFGFVRLYFEHFSMSPKGSSFQFFRYFATTNVKKYQSVLSFRFFGSMRLLKFLIFFPKISP